MRDKTNALKSMKSQKLVDTSGFRVQEIQMSLVWMSENVLLCLYFEVFHN